MPDLGNLQNASSPTLSRCPNFKPMSEPCDPSTSLCPPSVKTTIASDESRCCNSDAEACDGKNELDLRVYRRNKKSTTAAAAAAGGKCLGDYVKAWVEKKVESGVIESRCFLPFLVGAPKMVECLVCHQFVYPGEEVLCTVRDCGGVYHVICAKKERWFSTSRKFRCPHHACFVCKQKLHWRCARCSMASHDKCAAWPHDVIHLGNQPGLAICWRHPSDWRMEKKDCYIFDEQHAVPASNIEDVFCRLPLPYVEEEFKVNFERKDVMENKVEPFSYLHIKRNLYLIKKKRDDVDDGIGCTNCSSTCSENCVCRVQCISCSKACRCSEVCTNRPFRKEKRIKVVKTELCGWGVEAAECINKGDFVIEYIGEVIDDASCEQRLWEMKYKGVQNFYMCEIRKDFTIDATFKGNSSRFLNHSCKPNCILEKWQVEGETRVGVFAARPIKVGEPLTYDYRFVQFGPEVKCCCGASNCQGYLGTKRKIGRVNVCWGSKRKRSPYIRVGVVTV